MTTTVDNPTTTPVVIGAPRGGPDVPTLRKDGWWVEPVITAAILLSFVIYSTWAAFVGKNYYAGADLHRDLISPFYSPCIANTCYYYRKAYYRSFWLSPPACGVADAHGSYTGETRFPLILQNVHRYFFWILLVFNCILTYDAILAFRQPGLGIGVSVGTLVLCANAAFLWLYSLSCHACRHFCGGQVKSFAKHPTRHKLWKFVTPLNARHMRFAWISLFGVALCDLYVRLVASGTIHDPGFHF